MEELELENKINAVYKAIEDAIDDDNVLSEDEFNRIQELKNNLQVTSQHIYENKKEHLDRIMYLQLYLLLLDDNIDLSERVELRYYKDLFGYSEKEIFELEVKVRQDKQDWAKQKAEIIGNETKDESLSRNIPASIKKIVWDRDKGRCVLCGSTEHLEFDHDIPFSKGGSNSTENIRVLCRTCNRKKYDKIGLITED